MKYPKWDIRTPKTENVQRLCAAGYSRLLSEVLAARGVTTGEQAAKILQCDDRLILSPFLMRDMDKAVARILKAITQRETIAIFGDYDVDGITATVLLTDYLKCLGARCLRYIPRRIEDGYGLNKDALAFLRRQGATLVITVDCGITGNQEANFARTLGMDMVITDHHECRDELPHAAAVVDPHRPDCSYPFKHLAGVGVALKLVMALGGETQADELFRRYCTLAAIGTVADVMRMEGENRTIVSRGLEALPETDFVGIRALLQETGLIGKPVTSTQIGFVLSPRINAAGRMNNANLAADLLETADPLRAEELARELCQLNRERQDIEQEICLEAIEQIQRMPPEERSALVLSSGNWHQGVVGIVASRLSEKYACPSFMIHLRDGVGKGSCRSYGGVNLFTALESCADLLEGFGGHELAAGFTIQEENIPRFRERMNRYVRSLAGSVPLVSRLDIDLALQNPAIATMSETEKLDALEPYGTGNSRPTFALLGATVDAMQSVGQKRHMKFRLSKGLAHFDAIFFSLAEDECDVEPGMRVDAAFYLQINSFRGCDSLQLQLIDIRPSLIPSRQEITDLRLLRRLLHGESLVFQEIARLRVTRNQFSALWYALEKQLQAASGGVLECNELPFLRQLATRIYGENSFLRAALAIEVFHERGLISLERHDGRISLGLIALKRKVNLSTCPYLVRLNGGR